jgi:hypothetical protein
VYAGVAGVFVQVGHGRVDALVMGGQHGLFADIVGQGAQQRHAFGGGERQVEAVHGARGEYPPAGPVSGDPVIEPPARHGGVSKSTMQLGSIQPGQLAHGRGIPGHHPGRHPGIAFAVVLPQPAARGLAIHRRGLGLIGGVVVIVDAPPR